MDWSKAAFLFPGQGSQEVGMGERVASAYPAARATFDEADDILGVAFSDLCFHGPEDALNDTYNTQSALFVVGVATLRALQSELPDAVPGYAAGHSLGEFTALVCAGALSFEDGLRLVRERGRLMKEAGESNPGGMAAFLGLSVEKAEAICEQASQETSEPLVLANDNCPGQVVISGGIRAVERALELGPEAGAKRSIRLALSVAAHSPLMEPAAEVFRGLLKDVTFQAPDLPVYGNVSAAPLATVDDIRAELEEQILKPVRWTESMQQMIADGAETFVEIGSRDVLSGLLRRIDRTKRGIPVNSDESLAEFVANHKN